MGGRWGGVGVSNVRGSFVTVLHVIYYIGHLLDNPEFSKLGHAECLVA